LVNWLVTFFKKIYAQQVNLWRLGLAMIRARRPNTGWRL
jgi:hypothetical protein